MNNAPTMLACGCAAMSTHGNPHDGLPADHPSCVVHYDQPGACTIVAAPDLTGRKARCGYYGSTQRWRNSGPIYGGGDKAGMCENGGKGCRCEVPSDAGLPFFTYHGPGCKYRPQDYDEFFCGCAGWD